MKRELIIGIMLAVVCGLTAKDVLDAIRCRKREEELSLRLLSAYYHWNLPRSDYHESGEEASTH